MGTETCRGALGRALTIANPYLDEFLDAVGDPERLRRDTARTAAVFARRQHLVRRYAWAVPNAQAVATIVANGPVVELGAGAGYWAMLVAAAGGDIVAYDASPVGEADNEYVGTDRWFDVACGDVGVLGRHSDRALMLCWPPYDTPFADEALQAHRGDVFLYVGEGAGGCTGDDRFHARLEREWRLTQRVRIPCWPAIHDDLTVWHRR